MIAFDKNPLKAMPYALSICSSLRMASRLGLVGALCFLLPAPVFAITMANDPDGFGNFTWGAPLTDIPELTVIRADSHTIDYEFRNRPPVYADIPVEHLHLSTVDDQFARVTIRYSGAKTHAQMLQFLERSYGKIERLPGQMMRGLNQQYTWRGPDTEISLTYEANRDRGFIFIESRNLAPRFQDRMADTAD